MENKRIKEIGRCRDGGSLLVEFDGQHYFIDYGIGSETRGRAFYGKNRDGGMVPKELEDEIKANYALLSDLI